VKVEEGDCDHVHVLLLLPSVRRNVVLHRIRMCVRVAGRGKVISLVVCLVVERFV
jgi:hypothetical protein